MDDGCGAEGPPAGAGHGLAGLGERAAAHRASLHADQSMVRGALAALLRLEPDIEVVAGGERGDRVVDAALAATPDVALLDIEMPGCDGLAAAAALRASLPACRVVILTTFGRVGYLRRAMDGGAVGFLLKDAPAAELAKAVRHVVSGGRVLDPDVALTALSGGENPLTPREREVLAAATGGATVADIARTLWLSAGTVPTTCPSPSRSWGPAPASRRRASRSRRGGCRPGRGQRAEDSASFDVRHRTRRRGPPEGISGGLGVSGT